uniref:Uncharacterized protein n=1 Tax=Mycena chlorophos TaxID=658473 RepID=A0ABQ0KWM7_MYCCL|nr:predicted protein [Mycena chlorophos]
MSAYELLREEYQRAIKHAQNRISNAEDAIGVADTDNMKYRGLLARAQELLVQSNLRVVRAHKDLNEAQAEYDQATKNYEDAIVELARTQSAEGGNPISFLSSLFIEDKASSTVCAKCGTDKAGK